MKILVTGGLGFIGSNFIRYMLNKYPDISIYNIDAETYAGNPMNLEDIQKDTRYQYYKGSISNVEDVKHALKFEPEVIINFAAESHVDRSIDNPNAFLDTDIIGVHTLLNEIKGKDIRFVQISTDEVYGSIKHGSFGETDKYNPSSPYSASKASGELISKSYLKTYNIPIIITRASNNYGPYQYPEKLIPLFITNALEGKSLPLYGDGTNVRDWLYVEDHCEAIDLVMRNGKVGEIYNIGGGNEISNIDITKSILDILELPENLIEYVKDRPAHDFRYSIDSSKIKEELGWEPRFEFRENLKKTVQWYKDNHVWWKILKDPGFRQFYEYNYHF